MSIVRYINFDKTVETIAERNLIDPKIDNMVVTVKDSIADVDAGAGVSTYRWNANMNVWILISKSTSDTISFITEELSIIDGAVTASNIPLDDKLWGISVISNNVIVAEIRYEDLNIDLGAMTGLTQYNGLKLRFTYAFGTISSQIQAAIASATASAVATSVSSSGTIPDFEGALE